MKKITLLLFCFLWLVACATRAKDVLDQHVLSDLHHQKLSITPLIIKNKPENGVILKKDQGLFNTFRSAEAINEGRQFIESYNIPNLGKLTTEHFIQELRTANPDIQINPTETVDYQNATEANLRHALIVNIQSNGWTLNYFPIDTGQYRLITNLRARLIDIKQHKVLWSMKCHQVGNPRSSEGHSLAACEANNAKLLITTWTDRAKYCARKFAQAFLVSPNTLHNGNPPNEPK